MSAFLLTIGALFALVSAAFFAGVETGLLSVSKGRILHLARAGGRKAKILETAIKDMSRTTTMLLIGNNLSSVAYSTATAAISTELFARDGIASMIWSFLAAFTILYVSEFLPKLLCAARPLRRTLALADIYGGAEALLRPLTNLAVRVTNLFMTSQKSTSRLTAADLVGILQDRKDGVCLSDFESALITKIIVLRTKKAPITTDALLSVLREVEI